MTCGVLFPRHGGAEPRDAHGCILPNCHGEPHIFRADDGTLVAWKNDWDCNCDECKSDDANDWCVIYWTQPEDAQHG